MENKLYDLIVNMEEEEALAYAKEYLEEGKDAQELLDVCRDAMDEVGNLFEQGEYFLSELLLGGEIFQSIMALALPHLGEGAQQKLGKMVLGTVREDIHDIGKDIFKAFVEAAGFEVVDIGVDVPEDKFVEAVKAEQPDLVGMSCLITAGMVTMKSTIEALREAGLIVPVIIGGGRVDEDVKAYVGADAWADDAASGVRLSKELVGAQ